MHDASCSYYRIKAFPVATALESFGLTVRSVRETPSVRSERLVGFAAAPY